MFKLGNHKGFLAIWENPPKSHQLDCQSMYYSMHSVHKRVRLCQVLQNLTNLWKLCPQRAKSLHTQWANCSANNGWEQNLTPHLETWLAKISFLPDVAKSYFGLTFQPHNSVKNDLFGLMISEACRALKNG